MYCHALGCYCSPKRSGFDERGFTLCPASPPSWRSAVPPRLSQVKTVEPPRGSRAESAITFSRIWRQREKSQFSLPLLFLLLRISEVTGVYLYKSTIFPAF